MADNEPRVGIDPAAAILDLAKQQHQSSIADPQASTPLFRLLSLPPEIRELVWSFTVSAPAKQPVKTKKCPLPSGYYQRIPSTIAVAFACRQTYLEVTPIYYSQNTFVLSTSLTHILDQSRLRRFIAAIGPANTDCITSMCLVISKYTPHIDFSSPVPGFVYLRGNNPVILELSGRQLPLFCRCVPRRTINFVVIATSLSRVDLIPTG